LQEIGEDTGTYLNLWNRIFARQ